jgi:hypothetical protein
MVEARGEKPLRNPDNPRAVWACGPISQLAGYAKENAIRRA